MSNDEISLTIKLSNDQFLDVKNKINSDVVNDPYVLNKLEMETKKKEVKVTNTKTKMSFNFNEYFDEIYIINSEFERSKIDNLIKVFNSNNIKFKIIDKVNIKNNKLYLKLFNRWKYQKILDKKLLNRFIFDHEIYIKNNNDLKYRYNNKIQLWNHYLKYGEKENRILYEKTNIMSEDELNILISHINILKNAILNKYEKILILEENVMIHKDFEKIHDLLIKKFNDFDIILYGSKCKDVSIEYNLSKAKICDSSFAYSLDKKIFQELLDNCMKLINPINKCLDDIRLKYDKTFIINPNIIKLEDKRNNIYKEYI